MEKRPLIPHCKPPGAIGAELIFDSADSSIRTASQNDSVGAGRHQPVPVTYTDDAMTVAIPMDALADRSLDFEIITSGNATNGYWAAHDCAPDDASIHSPDGRIVPPQDVDRDGKLDWADMCLGEPAGWWPATGPHTLEGVVSLGEIKQPTINVSNDNKPSTFRGSATITNLNEFACWMDVSAGVSSVYPDIGLCQFELAIDQKDANGVAFFGTRIRLGAHEGRHLSWRGSASCPPSVSLGLRDVEIQLQARYTMWDYPWFVGTGKSTVGLRVH